MIAEHELETKWTLYYQQPGNKDEDYANSIHEIGNFKTVEGFWTYFSHIKRPIDLPKPIELHIFRNNFRGMWEDEINREGGKWFIRLKKEYSAQLWEKSVIALIGENLIPDVIGAVLAIREGTDILSFWNRTSNNEELLYDIAKNISTVLDFPTKTQLRYKRHQEIKDSHKSRQLSYTVGNEKRSNAPSQPNIQLGGKQQSSEGNK